MGRRDAEDGFEVSRGRRDEITRELAVERGRRNLSHPRIIRGKAPRYRDIGVNRG